MPKKNKSKPTRAEIAAEAELAFKKMNERWDKVGKFAGKYSKPEVTVSVKKPSSARRVPVYSTTELQEAEAELSALIAEQSPAPDHPSEIAKSSKFIPGVGAKKDSPHYTGKNIIGIAVMHKSSLVPVFNQESAVDIAKMRRG